MNNDLSYHNLSVEDATELALDRPLWGLLGSKRSYALNWCKLNNDDDYDDDDDIFWRFLSYISSTISVVNIDTPSKHWFAFFLKSRSI